MEIKKTKDSCTLTLNSNELRILKGICKHSILSSAMTEESLKHTPDDLKNSESFKTMIANLKEITVFSKAFEEKYNKEFKDKLVTAEELAEQEKHLKEMQGQFKANKQENEK